jgi:signal transduction histidine kinase/CheY-like chemotaxis protein
LALTTEHDPTGDAPLRGAALRILAGAVVACCLLITIAVRFVATVDTTLFATLLLAGAVSIVAAVLYCWHRLSEKRMQALVNHMRLAEQSRDEAESAKAENERMLASMSHEIRTPLNGVIGMLNLLLGSNLTAEQKNYAQTADASGRTLLSIIDEILDTAKGNATRTHAGQACQVRTSVESVTELLAARAHAKGLELSAHVAAGVPDVLPFDDTQLRQILFNLAGNAIKFTDAGGVAIDVMMDGENSVVLTVEDTGIGMTEAECHRIFRDYQQANGDTARAYGGTGLGLGITQRIVHRFGGEIAVESISGKGSRFRVRLPLPVAIATEVADRHTVLAGRNFKLAMIDGVSLRHLALALTELGAVVSVVASAAELRQLLKSTEPGFTIIADTSHATGLRHWVKSHHSHAQQQHDLWTILTPEERRNYPDFLHAPFAGYLLKPLRRATLKRHLTRHDDVLVDTAVQNLRSLVQNQAQRAGWNVLLADDSPVNLLLTRTMLEKNGHRVTTATNGMDALQLYKTRQTFDVLLLDVEMPQLDGYETARQLRQFEAAANVMSGLPILALTAHMRQQDLDRCITCGMNDYLSKPFDQHDLLEAIARLTVVKAA